VRPKSLKLRLFLVVAGRSLDSDVRESARNTVLQLVSNLKQYDQLAYNIM
jgi:hypothetical protein